MADSGKPITGCQVFLMFGLAFSVIIGVNLTLAFKAVATFPGLEVRNSYVASQSFDRDRAAQMALSWDVSAELIGDELVLRFAKDGVAIAPDILSATLGRATHTGQDRSPVLAYYEDAYRAHVGLSRGNWNLRLAARADDGTIFKQRVLVRAVK